MNPIMKLVRMMDWEDAHRPFKAEEKAELMELPDMDRQRLQMFYQLKCWI